MQISYAILTHNEGECIERLFQTILEYKDPQDEIVVVDDYSTDELTLQILTDYSKNKHIKLYKNPLNNNFANQKNYLSSKCSGDFIFNIDADEMVKPELLVNLKAIITSNPDVDLYAIPRENTVIGITPEHIRKWNWRLNKLPNRIDTRELDLSKSEDLQFYKLLKTYDLIISEEDL